MTLVIAFSSLLLLDLVQSVKILYVFPKFFLYKSSIEQNGAG